MLTVRNGVLLRGGRPFSGIGVNYFDALLRTLERPGETSYDAGFRALAARGIPFARINGGGFWPREWRLYRDDKAAFLARFDAVVRSAERHGVGLIPSLFWNLSTVPDLVGEPCDAWGDLRSETHALMRRYVNDVVTRYRKSPALWAWEFGNEYNLAADLPNASEHRPQIAPDRGTATSRSSRDELTHDAIRVAAAAFAKEVRRHDRQRAITSGNAFPRPSAWHQRQEKSWTKDSPQQMAQMLLADHPDPIDLVSVHAYDDDVSRIAAAQAACQGANKPLFVGEFGVAGPPAPEAKAQFDRLLGALVESRVPLAALWVYDFAGQREDWSVTADNARAYQLGAIAAANRSTIAP